MLSRAAPDRRALFVRARRPLVAAGLLALLLAGCAGNDVPVPFVTSPEPQAAAGEAPPAVPAAAPAATTPAPPASANARQAGTPGTRRAGELPFPSVGAMPAVPDQRPVMDAAAQARMEAELEGLARDRARKLKQEIEQDQ